MNRRPGVVVAIAAWLVAAGGMLLGGLFMGETRDPLILVLASQAAVALPVLLLLIPMRPRELGLGPASGRSLLTGAVVGPIAIGCSLALAGLTFWFAGQPPPQPVEQVIEDLHARFGLAGLVVLAAILPGVVEEALFRGVILTGLRRHLSPAAAVMISALMFAALHLSPWRFLPQLALGCLLGWLTLRTGSCWPAALAHAIHNGAVVVVARLAQSHA